MTQESASRNCLPCPFCGKAVDLSDPDTLHPSGTGWRFDDGLQMRTYHSFRDVPKEQWCWVMCCPSPAGGCDAEVTDDSEAEALAAWNRRTAVSERGELPAELFDGYAVYEAMGKPSDVSPRNVAAVLDAVVRLVRKSRA